MSATATEPSSAFRPQSVHLALLVPWVAIVINAYEELIDNSFLWHIRAGELQLSAAEVLTSDPFSYTMAGASWRTQSWLPELAYGWLESTADLAFTSPMVLGMSALIFTGLGLMAFGFSRSALSTAAVLVLSAVILPRFLVPRPVLVAYLIFVLVMIAWETKSQRWILPFLFWLWAATHGSFLIGLGYVGLRIIQHRAWTAAPVLGVSALVTLLTAHGLGVVSMLLDFLQAGEYLALISEWQSPDFLEPNLLPFVALITLVVFGAVKQRVDVGDLWLFVPFVLLAFAARRSVGFAWVALVPILARSLGPISGRWSRGVAPPVAVLIVILILSFPFLLTESGQLDDERFPVEAATHLEDLNTFHGVAAGGYLIYRYGPDRQVFIDDRVELYRSRIAEVVEIRSGLIPWLPVFERDNIEQALLDVNEPLVAELEASGWNPTYQNDNHVILESP